MRTGVKNFETAGINLLFSLIWLGLRFIQMAPKGRGRKKAEVVDKLEVHDTDRINVTKIDKVTKTSKKEISEEKNKNLQNGMNGSGESQEKTVSDEPMETASGSDVGTSNEVAPKHQQKRAKRKVEEDSTENENKEEGSKIEDADSKDIPAKRGRKAAKVQDDTDSKKDEDIHEADLLAKDSSRPKRKGKDVPSNVVKDQNKPDSKETKAKNTRKTKVQSKEEIMEKEAPSKVFGRKKKNANEKREFEAGKKVEGENPSEVDETRQLRVALKRNQNLDDMAKQQMEDAKATKESKIKNVKGPAKGKKDAKDSEPIKKNRENTPKGVASKKEKDKIPDVSALDFDNDSKTANGKPWNLKIVTWNVNGLRAWLEKNGMSYLHHEKPDIMCMQETKCSDDKLPPEVNVEGYHHYWLAGDKDGYSGVALLSKEKPISVQYGINMEKHDNEGRVITAEYDKFYLVTTYIPNAGRGLIRLGYRQEWDKDFRSYLKKLDEKKPVVLCGDLNVAHEEIDLTNPKSNKKNAGFTKEEREGFSTLLSEGYVDTFRHLYPDQKGAYTFWTYMMNARAKNVGWRLDYFIISKRFVEHLCDSVIRKDVYGSDHCPVALFLHV